MRSYFKPKITILESLPKISHFLSPDESSIILYDQQLLNIPTFNQWLTKHPLSLALHGGESLKEIAKFPELFTKVSDVIGGRSKQGLNIIAVGGGSIGDFAGFFASVYKRGVGLIHMPSTLLAAVDSAHGGKNALNGVSSKNQLGTFYFPKEVIICKNLIQELPKDHLKSGFGEVLKTALLAGSTLWELLPQKSTNSFDEIWSTLPLIIDYKYSVVERDPFEKTNTRRLLNLGHTVGHLLEKHFNLAHGEAVAQGIHFSLNWSLKRNYLTLANYNKINTVLSHCFPCKKENYQGSLSQKEAKEILVTDKKLGLKNKLHFVFIKGIGEPWVEDVTVTEIVEELYESQWVHL